VDWFRIVVIVLVVLLIAAALAALSQVSTYGSQGRQSLSQLETPAREPNGTQVEWSPVDMGRDLFSRLFAGLLGDGMVIDPWAVITGAFGSALIIVVVAVIIKFIARSTGG
jgi:hypothetical protein